VFIGKSCRIECTKFEAVFLSPRVHFLLQEDKTVDSICIEWKTDRKDEKRIFEHLEKLMKGFAIEPTESDVCGLLEVGNFLGNEELLNKFIINEGPIDKSTVCSRLRRKSSAGLSVENEIEFAASHFYELDFEELKEIDVSLLERIVSSESLHLTNEDSLLDFICRLHCECQVVVLRYLRSEYLSCEKMEIFLGLLSFDSNLDPLIWLSLRRRLLLPVSVHHSDRHLAVALNSDAESANKIEFPLKQTNSEQRIISYLTKKHGGNVHTKGVVTITSKSLYADQTWNAVKNVVDLGSGLCFVSKHEPDQWICWDFHDMRIRPTPYEINTYRLKSWVVEGSLDGENWTEIDLQTDNQDFKCWNKVSFVVSNPVESRFIRLTPTDENHYGGDHLYLCSVEFIGTLSE
jgi:hypothetical protein